MFFEAYPDVVGVGELCSMLRLGRNSVYSLLKSGKLRSVRIGTKYLIPTRWVEEDILFSDFMKEWLDIIQAQVKTNTYHQYRLIVNNSMCADGMTAE